MYETDGQDQRTGSMNIIHRVAHLWGIVKRDNEEEP